MTKINLHDVVALTEDTKVEKYNQGEAFEVEFAEKNGEAYALITIEAEKLFLLRFEPAELAFAS